MDNSLYLGVLLDGDQCPHGQPDGPLSVDVEVLDGFPPSSTHLPLEGVQASRVLAGYFCQETIKNVLQILEGLTILEKLDGVRIFTVILLKCLFLYEQLLQILSIDFFYHSGGSNTENIKHIFIFSSY